MKLYKYTWTYSLDLYPNSPRYTFEYIGPNSMAGLDQLIQLTQGRAQLWPLTRIQEVQNERPV